MTDDTLMTADSEIDRLRGELAALQTHFDIKVKLGDEKDAEIERLNYLHTEQAKTIRELMPENERLRKSLDDHLESEAAETRRADRERDRARTAEAEIERLRGALEAITIVPVGEGSAGSMRKIAVQALHVREALGE